MVPTRLGPLLLVGLVAGCAPVGEDDGRTSGATWLGADTGDTAGVEAADPEDTGGLDTGEAGEEPEGGFDTAEDEVEVVDYGASGGVGFGVSQREVPVTSCTMPVDLYTPDDGGAGMVVVLAHGFLRGQDQMAGWAEHLASWGLHVAVPSLCHSSLLDADHEANGQDLAALGQALGLGPVVYAGHSAGGLASVIAAAADPAALALVGLDVVDDGSGSSHASALSVPVYGLFAEAGSCNSNSNGVDLLARAADPVSVRVTDADHCDYENTSDWMCTSFCSGGNGSFDDGEIQEAIQGLATAAVMQAAGLDPAADHWWNSGGEIYELLRTTGAIQPL